VHLDPGSDDESKMGAVKTRHVVLPLVLIAAGFGYYSYHAHRELDREREILLSKAREDSELRERIAVLENQQTQLYDTTEMRLAGEQKAAISKESAEKLATEQRKQAEQQNAKILETLKQDRLRLEALKK
jgi:hypothetical protein